jgi:ribosome-associated toxin RatA of RatAB toxin-antitoxin module
MSITLNFDLAYEFEVKTTSKEVFDVLSDVPASASFYPQVEQLIDLGKNTYQWEMAKIGTDQFNLQTVYASKYVSSKKDGTIVWTPVNGIGNALVSGSWHLTHNKKSTKVVLNVACEVSLPLPALMKMVVEPVIEAEFERLTEEYIDNLIERFGGEV